MLIPRSFRVGRRRYKVTQTPVSSVRSGYISPLARSITITQVYKGRLRSPAQQAATFWHEVTHAILYDMDHTLWRNERFVTEFSKRLNQVCVTAKLGE